MALTNSQIAALYKTGTKRTAGVTKRRKRRANFVVIRATGDSGTALFTEPRSYVKAEQLQSFVGNVGSQRRSAKGRVYRLPNGWRKFDGYKKPDVVAYLARP